MFSRGHSCLRRRLSAVFDTVAAGPDEPLLFLYPRVASALQRRQPMTTLPPVPGPRKSPYTNRTSARPTWRSPTSLNRQSNRWKSDSTHQSDDNASLNPSQDAGREIGDVDPYALHEEPPRDESPRDDLPQDSEVDGDEFDLYVFLRRQDSYNPFADIENAPSDNSVQLPKLDYPEPKDSTPKDSTPKDSTPEDSRPEDSKSEYSLRELSARREPLERAFKPRLRQELEFDASPIEREVGNFWNMPYTTRKSLLREQHAVLDRGLRAHSDSEWESMIDLLDQVQDDPRGLNLKGEQHEGIEIPSKTLLMLSGNTVESKRENIWFIHVRTGCRVQVLDALESGPQRRVILSGSEYTIELVKERIHRINQLLENEDPSVHHPIKLPLPVLDSDSREGLLERGLEVPVLRAAWAYPELPARDPENIPEPLFSTVKDFAEHVEDLTHTPEPSRQFDRHRTPHAHQMASKITRLFTKEGHQRLFSSGALNIALKFLCKMNRLSEAGKVMLLAQPVATVESYNILLRNAALNRRFHIYRRYLRMMPRAHILPNIGTWSSLMQALTTPAAKTSLLSRITQRGFLKNPAAVRHALGPTLLDSLTIHLNSGQDIEPFLALMVKAAGPNWHVSKIMLTFFDTAGRLGHYWAIEQLTKICFKHRIVIDNRTLCRILEAYRGDTFLLFDYTLRILRQPGFKLDNRTKNFLFHAAVSDCHYNLSRVLWWYCCMDGLPYQMKTTVTQGLYRDSSWEDDASSRRRNDFDRNFAKVVVGIDLPSFHHEVRYQIPAEFWDNPVDFLMVCGKSEGDKGLHYMLGKQLVKHDCSVKFSITPLVSLDIMMEAALRIDFEWRNESRDLHWLLQNAIHVPFKHKASAEVPAEYIAEDPAEYPAEYLAEYPVEDLAEHSAEDSAV